jgi:hypothetical protein
MNGLDTINWIDTDYEDPKVGEVVLIYGGLAHISADGVWYTDMEQPPRPIMWRVSHWATRPNPSQSLIDQTEEQRKVKDMVKSLAQPFNGFSRPTNCRCHSDGTLNIDCPVHQDGIRASLGTFSL